MTQLPDDFLALLKAASNLSDRFSINDLTQVMNTSQKEVSELLHSAINNRFRIILEETHDDLGQFLDRTAKRYRFRQRCYQIYLSQNVNDGLR